MSVRKRKWTTAKGAEKEAWIVDYVDGNGTRRLKTFDKKKDADAWEAKTTVSIDEGTHVADRATVAVDEASVFWLEDGTAAALERSTLDQRRQHLNEHILPFLGKLRLSKLSIPVVRQFQDRLRTEPHGTKKQVCSADMIKRVTVSLGSLLADAQERGLVARNVVHDMSNRRKRKKNSDRKPKLKVGIDIPSPAEIRLIVEHSKGWHRPLIVTAIFTGLRSSELRGLRWSDVDLKAAELHVRQRADRYHAKKYVDEGYNPIGLPKSEAGEDRTIPLAPMVVNTLREWKLKCPKGPLDLVFPNGEGNIEFHANIVTRGLHPPQIAAGLTVPALDRKGKAKTDKEGNPIMAAKYTGLHALRHFYASWLINPKDAGGQGKDIKTVQARMGHSSIVMTADTYGHLFPNANDQDELAAAEKSLLGG
ncbi:site-specific integrase [Mesorhizobium sp. WSM4303]|uniref:tyrosine-type recombinase/integrase n=1 Tax=unclassified Mesorhizobium TaxID=325217 RepID=UPI00115D7762|nr:MULTISPECIES: site-specific integrase [unclassified Mesorhizobium]TRC92191.1 site-specific integrase [Mesorhizobium sp. WSM4306]TRC95579.1 site-specific integrase [Mesorhizobium sp. WSM4303]